MKRSFMLIFYVVFFACGKKTTPQVTSENKDSNIATLPTSADERIADNGISEQENKVINAVMDLPEIIKQADYIEKHSKGKNHLAAMIIETPEENSKGYYVVQISEDTEDRFVGMYSFNVYYPSMKIMWIDPFENEEMPLDKWRKQLKEE